MTTRAREDDFADTVTVRLDPRALCGLLGAVAAVLIVASVLQHLYPFEEPVGRINLDTEVGFATWFQAGLLALAAALAGLIAAIQRRVSKPYVGHWLVLAAALIMLSIDEALALHEELIGPLRSALNASGIIYFTWVVPGAALVALVAAAYARFVLRLALPARRYLLLGVGLYLWGVLAMEALNGAYASANGVESLTYRLLTDLEETFEMAGLVVLVYALQLFLDGPRLSARVAAHDRRSAASSGPVAARETELVALEAASVTKREPSARAVMRKL